MPDEENKTQKAKEFIDKVKKDENVQQGVNFFWKFRLEIFSGIILLVGLILSFYYRHIGGSLVGLGFGLYFFKEIHSYFVQLRDYYTERGLFKTLMLIGTVLFLLIAIPTFVLGIAVGYVAMLIGNWVASKR